MALEEAFKDTLLAFLRNCYNIYNFLSRAFEKEVTVNFLKKLMEDSFAFLNSETLQKVPDKELNEGLKVLSRYLERLKNSSLEKAELELAVEYANLFLGVKGLPHPSESAYKSGYIMERPMEEVLKAYREAGVDLKEDFKEPADHISTELQFMAYLSQKAADSGSKGGKDELRRELERRIKFLNKHLLPWIPLFAKTISDAAETDFYRGLVILTKRFVELDESLTKYMLAKLP